LRRGALWVTLLVTGSGWAERASRVGLPYEGGTMTASHASAVTDTGEGHGHGAGLYIALVPWVLFTLLAQHSTLKVAAVISLIVATGIMIRSITEGGLKLLELGAVIAFLGFTVVALAADHATGLWLARYSRAIAAALLALIAFGSLLFTPFTEQYARDSVPRKFWGSATFKATNRRLTTMWACVFTAMVPSHIAAGVIDKKPTNILFNWVIPIGLIVWGAKRSDAIAVSAKSLS
jgi:hypothetical protein